ncbi:hypothetical protein HME9304_00645 [Flagellimonas maritima]|uniref:Glycosyl hydrolase family 43 n=1 Tax=Flagellimonas maritima TaxID=1383885 RepID=A0A2Z4LQ00_9FLAO|nr:glycoside hydrolase family protein [Allomuricauda aurantiaca]AWX43654.1 hypothetical protein HME9304_00645 [Allomuricauda aurantiaca]
MKFLLRLLLIFIIVGCGDRIKKSTSPNKKTNRSFMDLLLPAPKDGGFQMDGYWVWGMSVIKGNDGKYHGYASAWKNNVPFASNWVTNSQIVHATSENPEGPYEFSEVVFERRGPQFWDGMMTHNPTIQKVGDTYLLYYIGATYDFPYPEEEIPNELKREVRGYQRIGLATSKSPFGPWKRKDKPILDVRPNKWDSYLTVNPSVCIKPNGKVLLVYKSASHKSGLLKLGLATADKYDGEYYRLSDEPIFDFNNEVDDMDANDTKHVEDPYMWYNGNSFELIMKDMTGSIAGEKGGGIHATSQDGIDWKISTPPKAYSKEVLWNDGVKTMQARFERPQLLIENGRPTHMFIATGTKSNGIGRQFDKTWNMCIPLKTNDYN